MITCVPLLTDHITRKCVAKVFAKFVDNLVFGYVTKCERFDCLIDRQINFLAIKMCDDLIVVINHVCVCACLHLSFSLDKRRNRLKMNKSMGLNKVAL